MNQKIISLAAVTVVSALPQLAFAADSSKPNIILIMCDDLMDFDGIYQGQPLSKTPNLDMLKSQSVCFSNAHSSAPLSSPSRASLFTGVNPSVSAYYGAGKWFDNAVLADNHTIMSHLKECGYNTYGTGKLLHDNITTEFCEFGELGSYGPVANDGVSNVGHPGVPEAIRNLGVLDGTYGSLANDLASYGDTNLRWNLGGVDYRYVSDDDRDMMGDEKIAKWAVDKLHEIEASGDDTPFFMGVGFYRPHTPLVVPQKYYDRFPLESINLPDWIEGDTDDTYLHEVSGKDRGYQLFRAMQESFGDDIREGFRGYLQAYLASMNFADEQVGKVLDALNDSSFRENTIVIFTADHGYDFGQKEHIFKNSLWTTSTQVPFLLRTPDAMGGKKLAGKVSTAPISLIDIFPTVVDYAGVSTDSRRGANGAELSGHSVRSLVENPKIKVREDAPVALTVVRGGDPKYPQMQNFAVKGERWRYILYRNGREELYDCKSDPDELTNLADNDKYKQIKAEMYGELKRQVPAIGEPVPAN